MNTKFLKVAAKDKNIGAISSSSKFLVKRVIDILKNKKLQTIIEYGSGDGVMTKELLKLLPQNGKLFAIETNATFVETLKKINDDRLVVIHGKAQDVDDLLREYDVKKADLVISSLPFSWFNKEDKLQLMNDSLKILKPEGDIVFFHQYTPVSYFQIKKFFSDVKVYFVTRNLFPCLIISAQK